jgi:putative ABC transport system ATP-binding protein
MRVIYRLKNVVKTHITAEGIGFRLVVPSLEIKEQEAIALVGSSGSGKSTLLDMLALLQAPDRAALFEFSPPGANTTDIDEIWARQNLNKLANFRRAYIGYVLQTGGLLPYLSVRENIELPRRLLQLPEDDSAQIIAKALEINRQLDKLPAQLSAGERQRVAFARALAHQPKIIIADEPTSSLDPITARKVMAAVMELIKDMGVTMVTASHDWAHVYKLDFRSLHQISAEKENGVVESIFKD